MKLWTVCRSWLGGRRRGSSFLKQDSGQSLVEVALVLPVVFLMTFGLIYFCLVLFSMGSANFASRAALRWASLHSVSSYVPATQQGLSNAVAPFLYRYPSNTYSVSSSYSTSFTQGGTNTVGQGVCITLNVSYPFSVLGTTFSPISYSSTACGIVLQ